MIEEAKTVEVPAAEPEQAPKQTEVVTREQLKEKGWSKAELDAAEKRGMIPAPEKKSEPEKSADDKALTTDKAIEPEKKVEPVAKLPGNFLDDMDMELSPAQEKIFLEMFPPGTKPRAFYYRAKNERRARQRVEQERDRIALELQTRKDEEARRASGVPEPEVDADGNVIDPEDKPLTMKQLRELQKKEREEMAAREKEMNSRAGKVSEALVEQEEYAKSVYPDFEETVKLATDLVNNLEKVSDPLKRSKIVKMAKDLQVTAGNADKYGLEDYTASMIAYELGQMHPEYGQKKPDQHGEPTKDPKANGSLTPEQMKRIEENTQRRASSASIPGSQGGKRTISVNEVTVKDLLKMSPEGRFKFKKDNPSRYAELMRG